MRITAVIRDYGHRISPDDIFIPQYNSIFLLMHARRRSEKALFSYLKSELGC